MDGTMRVSSAIGQIGTQTQQAGIERHQFLLRSGWTPEQNPGESDQAVDLDQNVRKLGVANGARERLAGRFDARVLQNQAGGGAA